MLAYLIISSIIVTFAAFYAGSASYTASTRELINPHPEQVSEPVELQIVPQPEMYLNTLLLGVDPKGLGDAIIVISYNLYTNQVVITSIPRNTYVEDRPWVEEGYGASHICFANYVGMGPDNDNYHNGAAYTAYWLESLFGLTIHEYVVFTFDGLIELVDLAGGIEVYIEAAFADLELQTFNHNTIKPLPTGLQLLTGEQVVSYARFRGSENLRIPEPGSDSEDGDRIRRSQRLIKAAFTQVRKMNLTEILGIVRQVPNLVHTSFSIFDLTALAPDIYQADLDNLTTLVIPGETVTVYEEGSGTETLYFYADFEKTAELLQSHGLR